MFDDLPSIELTFGLALLLLSIGAFLGVLVYRFYQSRLIRYLPQTAPLRIEAFFSESYFENEGKVELPPTLAIKITNIGNETYHFESWFIRAINGRGGLRQLFQFPQNFVRTLRASEHTTIEVQDISFLEEHYLHTICLRDIYGREWEISKDQIVNLKKDYFWQSLS